MENKERVEKIVLGGGCFWCTEAIFKRIKGVLTVLPGYAGGDTEHPTYQEVSLSSTGHAEVVEVTFNSNEVSLKQLLKIFFIAHDPTTQDRQGADIGSQYRSIILFITDDQRNTIQQVINEEQKNWPNLIITEVKKLKTFYKAEEYHIDYYERNRNNAYCRFVIQPKIDKILRR